MEKNFHSHLFASALSVKERRLVFMAGEFATEAEFQSEADKLNESIKNPETETTAAQAEVRLIQIKAALDKNPGRNAKINELIANLRAREDADRSLIEIKSRTEKGNVEWDAIVKGVKLKEGTPAEQAAQLTKAKDLIAQSYADIKVITELVDKPYNYMAQIEAHNANVVKTKGLDPENAELDGSAGVDAIHLDGADNDLADLTIEHGQYMLTLEPLLKTAEGIKADQNPAARKAAEAQVDDSVKTQKVDLEAMIKAIFALTPPQYNAEKMTTKILENMRNIDDVVNTRLGRKVVAPAAAPNAAPNATPAAPNAAPNATPAAPNAAPNATPAAPNATPNAGPNATPAAPNATPNAAPNAASASVDVPKQVEAVKDAIVKGDAQAIEKALEDFNKLPSTKDKQARVDDINKALADAKHTKTHAVLDASDKIVVVPGVPATPTQATEASREEKTKLQTIIDMLKELISFLRGERRNNGDLGALEAEVKSIDEQIATLKRENPDFARKPDISRKITDLEVKRQEIQVTIDQGRRLGSRVTTEANSIIRNSPTPLFVRVGQDRSGNAFLMTTQNTPAAQGHLEFMATRLQKVHPELAIKQRAANDQRVYFNFYGDVNINSNNDNRRTIDNRTRVVGDNNTVSVSADRSQNGNNEAVGGVGAAQDARATNRGAQRPRTTAEQTTTPAPEPQVRRARVVDAPPPTGDLS